MLAMVGILVQQGGYHFPGEQFTNTDIFGAPGSVGFAGNLQVFLAIGCVEAATFNQHYGDGEPGDFGLDGGLLKNKSAADIRKAKEQEIVHGRLAMIAFIGATVQTLITGESLF